MKHATANIRMCNAVADIVVFGKVASESAVEYCDR